MPERKRPARKAAPGSRATRPRRSASAGPAKRARKAVADPTRIVIRGASEHNLKKIDLELPRNQLVVFTGLSGSGKSSLAFDTIYAEGQRRYVESLSAYARQFLEQMEKPDVEQIEGLSPAISIEQRTTSRNPRSTVGTVTEIYDYLRLLFARAGRAHCHKCGREIAAQTVQQIADRLLENAEGTKLQLLAPIVRGRKGEYRRELDSAVRRGFVRARIDGQIVELSRAPKLDKRCKHNIEIVVDRLVVRHDDAMRNRLTDSLETALRLGEGLVLGLTEAPGSKRGPDETLFSEKLACIECGTSMPEMSPRAFSFNSPYGACPECDGLGVRREIDEQKLIPDRSRSIHEGALVASGWSGNWFLTLLKAINRKTRVDPARPWGKLPSAVRHLILHGSGEQEFEFEFKSERNKYVFRRSFEGVIPHLERRHRETHSTKVRDEIEKIMSLHACSACKGRRLRPESLAVDVAGRSIDEYTSMSVRDADEVFRKLQLGHREAVIAKPILKEICERVGFLLNVGLSYLALDRSAVSLSGGEGQRIRLATQIGSRLTGVLYVLDEPSIGLHQRDNRRLLDALEAMRDLGNTVIVVEHDEETIRAADWVVDLGPGAGEHGGKIVAAGTPEEIERAPDSLTGRYLSGELKIEIPEKRRQANGNYLAVEGAAEHNLRNLKVRFPLGLLTVVTGVSGSGKSTLVNYILYRALARKLYRANDVPGRHKAVKGIEKIDKVVQIDQSPIGRTPRSNPATYTGTFSYVRELFSRVLESRARGYTAGRYSFNVKGGRCEACQGDGIIKIEMHFLPDVYVTCEVCKGRRYNRETLEILYKGKNIADVLEMSIEEALSFFENVPYIRRKLETLDAVGLSYVRLGQPATTLSGGEAQRVKLSKELSRRSTGRTVYFLDEPTTGLHFDDIKKLLRVLERLVDEGNTVIVIEHNLDVIKTADHVIDLGPDGGDQGGSIVASGTPEQVAAVKASHTGRHLRRLLGMKG